MNNNSLRDVFNILSQNNSELAFRCESCAGSNSIYDSAICITPLWQKRKEAEEAEARRIETERQLKEDRLRRGTGEAVDLGLSVLWGSRNIGAPSGDQPGYYVGWGDVTGTYASLDYKVYPSANPPVQISGGEYDIAQKMWAEEWRIPTLDEFAELMQKCQWMWTVINGVPGFQVIGSTGKSIFLPAGGDRYGMQYEDAYYFGRYWTGNLFDEETARAYFIEFSQQNVQINTVARYMGMLIRPVIDKEK